MIALKFFKIKKKTNQSGVTLIEILIGVSVFSLIFTGILSSLQFASTLTSQQNDKSLAITIMGYVLDDIFSQSYTNISSSSLYTKYNTTNPHHQMVDLNGAEVLVNVTNVANPPNTKKILVTLNWNPTKASFDSIATKVYRSKADN